VVGSEGLVDCDTYGAVRLGTASGWETVAVQPEFDPLGDYLHPARLKGFAAQLQDFIEAVRDRREPAVSAVDGRAAVEMAEAAERSARTGRVVGLPLR
jgi:predicted dehydrogenase